MSRPTPRTNVAPSLAPFVADWPAVDRGALELALREGIVIVAARAEGPHVLAECTVASFERACEAGIELGCAGLAAARKAH